VYVVAWGGEGRGGWVYQTELATTDKAPPLERLGESFVGTEDMVKGGRKGVFVGRQAGCVRRCCLDIVHSDVHVTTLMARDVKGGVVVVVIGTSTRTLLLVDDERCYCNDQNDTAGSPTGNGGDW
jgi:hypothetical protein